MGGKEEVSYLYDDYLVHHKSNVKKRIRMDSGKFTRIVSRKF